MKALDKEALNSMCITCLKLGKGCAGTACKDWTGCVYRNVSTGRREDENGTE